ncbi:hypothetical protein [Sagittula stellata]|uniref:Putative hydratase protein n=1 Tax=Sagittula stellata (strain ATCC 700073 / DSM 11524 / E-37) TaxID=388399 RepID=A3JYL4_SAGS3|nr:hypothetical protein [Sagittula stellata]EBA09567.1 putative hydratase protein [Sagittula stellata E-37]
MTTTEAYAAALIQAHASRQRADATALPAPTYDEALAIQSRVMPTLGAVSGFKVADRVDGPPVIAPIPASRTLATGAVVPVIDLLGIELEIGFECLTDGAADLKTPAQYFRPRIVLELVDTRLTGRELDPMTKLADMQINAGLILGPVLEDWDGSDFSTVNARLTCNDRTVIDGPATVPGGSALANLALFCAHVGQHCGGLRQGQTVITGSLSGLEYFPAGTKVAGHIDGFGGIGCTLG